MPFGKYCGLAKIMTISMAALLMSCSGERPTELRIGTASQGGAFYPIGQSISSLVNEHAADMSMVPITTFGSVGNPRLVQTGEMDIAITSNNLVGLARAGTGPYAKTGPLDIAALGPLHASVLHMMTLKNSSVNTISDLRGKRIAVGPAGGGTIPFLTQVLALEGMSMDDIIPSYLSYTDGFAQLSDGNVDAAFALSGYPAGAVMQARANKDIKFISLTAQQTQTVLTTFTNASLVTIPKDVYGTPQDGIVLGVLNILITQSSAPADQIYKITEAIYGHLEQFSRENAIAKQISLTDLPAIKAPLHPGAQAYFDSLKTGGQ